MVTKVMWRVTLTEIEWDADPNEYSQESIQALPKTASVEVNAPDAETALDWGMDDITDDHGFCIQGCKSKVERI